VLRHIAFEERKLVAKLIHEGLDHLLTKRGYLSIAELRRKSQ
jgi:hypothetical protein